MYNEEKRVYGQECLVKVATIQMSFKMGQKKDNVAKTLERIKEASANGAKLIILPELCNSGYVFNSREEAYSLAEEIPAGYTTQKWIEAAEKHNVYIVAGIVEKEGADMYNASILVGPDGYIGKFRKLHLWDEDKLWFEPGNLGIPVFHTPIGKISMLICYDMWFSEAWRICALKGADIVCVPTNWLVIDTLPEHVQTMAPYMAMVAANTNALFIACADRVGKERGIVMPGRSLIVGPSGWPSAGPGSPDEEEILYADCNLTDARKFNWAPHTVLFRDRRTDYYDEMLGSSEVKSPF